MHEAGLIRSMLKQLEALAQQHHSEQIVGLKLQIRDTGNYSADHFRDHLLALSVGTVLEHAQIDINLVADEMHVGAPEITILSIEVPA